MGFGMNIEKISVEKLLPAKYNPRKDLQPGDPEFEKLKRSITEFGYVEPIIWNKRTGVVIGGPSGSRCCSTSAIPRWTASCSTSTNRRKKP